MRIGDDERGMILVSVLAMIALAATAVTLMLAAETPALDRARRFGDSARAAAIARGGEASVAAALRHDNSPDGDGWRHVAQSPTRIAGGRFALRVDDAQRRINVNNAREPVLAAIAAARGLPPDTATRVTRFLARHGPVRDLAELAGAGLAPATIDALRPLVTALPGDAPVNLNTVSEELLAILLRDPAQARLLVSRRGAVGRLTPDDLALEGVTLPETGFSTDHVMATTVVAIGGTTRRLTSLIERRRIDGRVEVIVLDRTRDQRAR